MSWRRACLVSLSMLAAACANRGAATADELRSAIAAYERGDAGATDDRITALFARLDAEVSTLKAEELERPPDRRAELAARRADLTAQRRDLEVAYLRARVKRVGVAADDALKSLGEQLGRGLEDAGRALRESTGRESAP
jgi:hypothetical protein